MTDSLRDGGGLGVPERHNTENAAFRDLAHRVRRAVMISMSMTEKAPAVWTHDDYDDAHAALNGLVALAKRGEAYEAQLAHARSLYRDGQQPTTAKLATKVRRNMRRGAPPGSADAALSELVKRAAGHVPVETFAAAMTALEQAEKERDEAKALCHEADSFISHMLARGSWPESDHEVQRLIGRLREA